jgi:hypothetical protein
VADKYSRRLESVRSRPPENTPAQVVEMTFRTGKAMSHPGLDDRGIVLTAPTSTRNSDRDGLGDLAHD